MHVKIYPEDEHAIAADDIDKDALNCIFHLKRAGFDAYLVGGGVRDLLLKIKPKDFDISTSAKPEEIKRLFHSRCVLIGKRFRLAHIRFGRKIIEVSTFRSGDLDSASLIVRDNRWGTAEEDVLRRDFTINALFYDPTTRAIIDYVGGYHDIKKQVLRTIGDPTLRFKQDPVRMIRLLKFQARLNFTIEHKTQQSLHSCRDEIIKSSPERILEEFFKMLESGAAQPFFALMQSSGFMEMLLPCMHHFFGGEWGETAMKYLTAIDTYHKHHPEKLPRDILFTALVFPILEQELLTLSEHRNQQPIPFQDIVHLSETLLQGINSSSFIHLPKKMLYMVHILSVLQYRLTPMNEPPKFLPRYTRTNDFHLALQFLQLRAAVDKHLHSLFTEWTTFAQKHSHHHPHT